MSNARIIEIPATRQIRSGKNNTMRKMRVAAYCRVSTEEEEQQGSFETQKLYYTEKINSTSEWELAGIYADDGISGIHTKKRDGFNQMIQDLSVSYTHLRSRTPPAPFSFGGADAHLIHRLRCRWPAHILRSQQPRTAAAPQRPVEHTRTRDSDLRHAGCSRRFQPHRTAFGADNLPAVAPLPRGFSV